MKGGEISRLTQLEQKNIKKEELVAEIGIDAKGDHNGF